MVPEPELVALYDEFYSIAAESPFLFVVKAVDACRHLSSWDDRAAFVAAHTVGTGTKARWAPSGETLRHMYEKANVPS